MVMRRYRFLAVASVSVLLLAACNGDDATEQTPVPDEPDETVESDEGDDEAAGGLERGNVIGGDTDQDQPDDGNGAAADEPDPDAEVDDGDGGLQSGNSSSNGLERGGIGDGSDVQAGDTITAADLDRRVIDLFADLEADATEEGTMVELVGDVLFDFDEAELRSDADPVLEDLRELAEGTGDVTISVVGHTDGVGSDDYNLGLSERRADAVVDGLVDRGVDSGRMESEGRGSSEPVAEEGGDDDEQARAQNRRVEVTFEGVDLDG